MNIVEINKIVIGLFFIYIVLFSSDIQLILNCELQKMMKNNIYFRHILVFISIYLFVFVLRWYHIDAIVVKDEFSNIQLNNRIEYVYSKLKNNSSYLLESLLLTVIAYLIFLLSTKVDISIFKYVIVSIIYNVITSIIKSL